jgi:hypothetical protein
MMVSWKDVFIVLVVSQVHWLAVKAIYGAFYL